MLRALALRPCNGCFGCWTARPGECLIDDDARTLAARVIAADVVAVAGPVRFGSWGSLAKVAFDRIIGLLLPHFTRVDGEIHHQRRYARYPRRISLGVVGARDAESEELFRHVMARNAINLHAPAHAAGVIPGDRDPRALARELVAAVEAA